jgi:hypothetical protein
MSDGAVTLSFQGIQTNTEARNNLWYNIGSQSPGCTAAACSNNVKATSVSVFLNALLGNFRLTSDGAAGSGFVLSAPFDKDLDGVTRGAGSWDIGAFEFGGSGSAAATPSPPANLLVVN